MQSQILINFHERFRISVLQTQILIDQDDLDAALGVRFFMNRPDAANSRRAAAIHEIRGLDARCFSRALLCSFAAGCPRIFEWVFAFAAMQFFSSL